MGQTNIIAAIIFGIGSIQGLIVAFNLLLIKKGNIRANRVLMALILSLTLIIFQNFIGTSGFYRQLPHLIFMFYPLNGLLGPLFLFYVLVLLFPNRRFHWFDLVHLFGFIVLLFMHWRYLWSPAELKIGFAEYTYFSDHQIPKQAVFSIVALRIHTLSYAIGALVTIHRKIRSLKGQSSNNNISYLHKFKHIAALFAGFAGLSMMITIYAFWVDLDLGLFEVYGHIVNASFLLAIAVITVHFPKHLFFTLREKRQENKSTERVSSHVELYEFMTTEKYFLNPDLKLHDLARHLEIPPHTLSEKINQELHMNFYDFVNHFRIQEFKHRAASPENSHLTLLGLAYDVGFNSKASFNRIFKKNTGLTPSQYLKQKGLNF